MLAPTKYVQLLTYLPEEAANKETGVTRTQAGNGWTGPPLRAWQPSLVGIPSRDQGKTKGPHLDRPEPEERPFLPLVESGHQGKAFKDTIRDTRTQFRGEGTVLEGRDNRNTGGYRPGTGHSPAAAIGAAAPSAVPSGGGTLQGTPVGTEVVAALARLSGTGSPPSHIGLRAKRDSPGS